MPGTKAGGKRAAATNYARHGKDFYKRIGAMGGRNGHAGGFAANRELARIAGAIGGFNGNRTGIKNGEGKSPASLRKYAREKAAQLDAQGIDKDN